MKDRILQIGKTLWSGANSNIGSAMIGASTAYILTRGNREDEIHEIKGALQNMESDNTQLKHQLALQEDRINALRDSRQQIERSASICENSFRMLRYAYDNTMLCLFKPKCSERPSSDNKVNHSKPNVK